MVHFSAVSPSNTKASNINTLNFINALQADHARGFKWLASFSEDKNYITKEGLAKAIAYTVFGDETKTSETPWKPCGYISRCLDYSPLKNWTDFPEINEIVEKVPATSSGFKENKEVYKDPSMVAKALYAAMWRASADTPDATKCEQEDACRKGVDVDVFKQFASNWEKYFPAEK